MPVLCGGATAIVPDLPAESGDVCSVPMQTCTDTLMSDKTENARSPTFTIQPIFLLFYPFLEMAEFMYFEMLRQELDCHWQAILATGFYFSHLSHSWLGFPSLSK